MIHKDAKRMHPENGVEYMYIHTYYVYVILWNAALRSKQKKNWKKCVLKMALINHNIKAICIIYLVSYDSEQAGPQCSGT